MTTRPYELLARFGNDGKVSGAHVRNITIVDGREFEGQPVPLSDTRDAAFIDFAEQFAAAAIAERDSLQTQLDAANARVADLLKSVPYNPRILKGEAFYNRVSKEDMVTLLTSDNPQLVLVGKTIDAYRDNKWPVVLDSTDFQQLVGYVMQSGVFDEKEVLAIMTDATREEAYGTE
jgi:hypothetical protein